MKKLILGLLLFSISILGYSQNAVEQTAANVTDVKEAVDAVKQATTQVNPTVVYFTEKLQELAKSLKVPAEHVYSVLVKNTQINACVNIALLLITYLCGVILLIITLKSYSNKNKRWRLLNIDSRNVKENPDYNYYDLDDGWHIDGLISSLLILFIAFIFTLIDGSEIISNLFNPEYGAIKEIMQLF